MALELPYVTVTGRKLRPEVKQHILRRFFLMTLSNILRIAGLSTLLFATAGIAAAQTTATAELTMNATVETAVQLNISTSTSPVGATVTGAAGSGAFTVNLGSVNGLGIGTPATGVSVAAHTGAWMYSTPITLTPVYSGFTTETASVTKANSGGADEGIAWEGPSAGSMALMTTTTGAFTGAASGSTNTRYVGFRITRTEAAGAKTSEILYSVIVN
jgi:hypothetical protein